MIDSKLSENGHDVPKVQVVLLSTDPSCEFSLEDEEGRFLTVPAAVPEREGSNSPGDSEEEREQDDTHSGYELDDLRVENQSLKDELTNLQQKLKTRFRDLWRTNCQFLAEYDALVTAKDSDSRPQASATIPFVKEFFTIIRPLCVSCAL